MKRSPIIVVGASAGGVAALRALAAGLPRTLAAPVLIVLHIGAHKSEVPALLNAVGALPAKHGEDGETIQAGHIYVAPPDRHMIVAEGRLRLLRGPKENSARPAIDPLFRSAAESHGLAAVGVILTGRLNDGTLGLAEIKRRRGTAIVQDPAEAEFPDMPRSAARHARPDYCLPLAEIPGLLMELVNGKDRKEYAMPTTPPQPDIPEDRPIGAEARPFERPLAITCPECGGALKRSRVGSVTKFGCHIGHSYTAEAMAAAQFEEMEKVIRAAVRCLNERAEFCRQMAEDDRTSKPGAAAVWQAVGAQAMERAYALRDLIELDWIDPQGCAGHAPGRPPSSGLASP